MTRDDGITELFFKDRQHNNNEILISIREIDENAEEKRRINGAKQQEDKYKVKDIVFITSPAEKIESKLGIRAKGPKKVKSVTERGKVIVCSSDDNYTEEVYPKRLISWSSPEGSQCLELDNIGIMIMDLSNKANERTEKVLKYLEKNNENFPKNCEVINPWALMRLRISLYWSQRYLKGW